MVTDLLGCMSSGEGGRCVAVSIHILADARWLLLKCKSKTKLKIVYESVAMANCIMRFM